MRRLVKGECGFSGSRRQARLLEGITVLNGCKFMLVSWRW